MLAHENQGKKKKKKKKKKSRVGGGQLPVSKGGKEKEKGRGEKPG